MMIHEVTEQVGRHKRRKRVGRGIGSGHGKTCGRGHKGYGSRSGNSSPHDGGGTPLYKMLPKRGFSNAMFKKHFALVNIAALDARFEDGAEVNAEMLVKHGLIRDTKLPVKVLGTGDTQKKFNVTAAKFSKSAEEKITKAGGSVNVQ
ncbi:MAG: 50S ribosomal protein L15 [Phycisphaerales bacterium JB063]